MNNDLLHRAIEVCDIAIDGASDVAVIAKCKQTRADLLKAASLDVAVIKKLPWTCGNCGRREVQNLRAYGVGPSFIATCDHCGTEWVS